MAHDKALQHPLLLTRVLISREFAAASFLDRPGQSLCHLRYRRDVSPCGRYLTLEAEMLPYTCRRDGAHC
jgi:hypothetical protein